MICSVSHIFEKPGGKSPDSWFGPLFHTQWQRAHQENRSVPENTQHTIIAFLQPMTITLNYIPPTYSHDITNQVTVMCLCWESENSLQRASWESHGCVLHYLYLKNKCVFFQKGYLTHVKWVHQTHMHLGFAFSVFSKLVLPCQVRITQGTDIKIHYCGPWNLSTNQNFWKWGPFWKSTLVILLHMNT